MINIEGILYKLKICTSFKDRLIGLSFKKHITNCYMFPRCNSIHTFFMFKNIDIIITDKNNKIIFIKKNLKPWKIILPKKNGYYTYELPSGSINNLSIGDHILYSNS